MRFEEILVLATAITGITSLVFIKSKKKNWIIDNCKAFFPVLLIVLLLRSFIYEPFRIPSGSMKPTLLVGDYILVNKYDYGIRLPVTGTTLFTIGKPKIGDVVVFRQDDGTDVIKRVVGLPGDHIRYYDNQLYLNDKRVPTEFLGDTHDQGKFTLESEEDLNGVLHDIYTYPREPKQPYAYTDVVVPEDSYFVMGDNRNGSYDSRFFGYIKDKDLIGRAVGTWMSWGKGVRWSRIGKSIYK